MAAEGHELSAGDYIVHHLTFWQNHPPKAVLHIADEILGRLTETSQLPPRLRQQPAFMRKGAVVPVAKDQHTQTRVRNFDRSAV